MLCHHVRSAAGVSPILSGDPGPYNATTIEDLRDAGRRMRTLLEDVDEVSEVMCCPRDACVACVTIAVTYCKLLTKFTVLAIL